MLRNNWILGDPRTKGDEVSIGYLTSAFSGAQKGADVLCNPCVVGHTQTKGDEMGIGYLGPAFLGAHKRAEVLCNPWILGIPKQTRRKPELVASPVPPRGPKRGPTCYVTFAMSCIPKERGTKAELATSPVPSRGPITGRKCYVTPAFSGIPKQKGDKIRIGCLTLAFSWAQKRAALVCNP